MIVSGGKVCDNILSLQMGFSDIFSADVDHENMVTSFTAIIYDNQCSSEQQSIETLSTSLNHTWVIENLQCAGQGCNCLTALKQHKFELLLEDVNPLWASRSCCLLWAVLVVVLWTSSALQPCWDLMEVRGRRVPLVLMLSSLGQGWHRETRSERDQTMPLYLGWKKVTTVAGRHQSTVKAQRLIYPLWDLVSKTKPEILKCAMKRPEENTLLPDHLEMIQNGFCAWPNTG